MIERRAPCEAAFFRGAAAECGSQCPERGPPADGWPASHRLGLQRLDRGPDLPGGAPGEAQRGPGRVSSCLKRLKKPLARRQMAMKLNALTRWLVYTLCIYTYIIILTYTRYHMIYIYIHIDPRGLRGKTLQKVTCHGLGAPCLRCGSGGAERQRGAGLRLGEAGGVFPMADVYINLLYIYLYLFVYLHSLKQLSY